MRITLLVLSVISFAAGVLFLSAAKTPISEIEAFMLVIVTAVLLSAAAVIDALTRGFKRVEKMQETLVELAKRAPQPQQSDLPPVSETEANYWVRLGDDSNGPFPMDKIRELHRRGTIDDNTPLALQGAKVWKKTRDVIGA
jgi:hypothetical protein